MGKFNYDSMLQLAGAFSQMGSAMDPNPNGFAARMGAQGYDATQAEIMRRAVEKQQQEQEKQQKAGSLRQIGSMLGGAALGAIPGVGPVASAGLAAAGGMAGGATGSALGGGKISGSQLASDGLTSGLSAFAAPKVLGSSTQMPGGLGQGADTLAGQPAMQALEQGLAKNAGSTYGARFLSSLGNQSLLGGLMGGGMGGMGTPDFLTKLMLMNKLGMI